MKDQLAGGERGREIERAERSGSTSMIDGSECVERAGTELDWEGRATDQVKRSADQERGMDLEGEDMERGASSVADNACKSGVSGGKKTEDDNLGGSAVDGMDIDQPGEGDISVVVKGELGEVIERESGTEDYYLKAEVSSSRGNASNTNHSTHEGSLDHPLSRLRRSDALCSRIRRVSTAKTRSSSLTSQRSSAKLDPHTGATPDLKVDKDARGIRKRVEDREELRRSSSSEELHGDEDGDGDEVDATQYRCGICNEEFSSAKSLNFHKCHPQYTLRRNPKRSRKLIDQEVGKEAGAVTTIVQVSAITKKTSSMTEDFPKSCTECGKEFLSWKALFGHMRCHPEREWRGIQPPAEESNARGQGSGGNHSSSRRRRPAPVLHVHPPPAPAREDNVEISASLNSRRVTHVWSKASDDESDTESIEAAYMSNGDRDMGYGTTWSTRSKRSRQTHRSLDAVSNAKKEWVPSSQGNIAAESTDMAETLMLLQCNPNMEKLVLMSTPESHGSKSRTPEFGVESETEDVNLRDAKTEAASPCEDTEECVDEFEAGEQGTSTRPKYECATCKRQFKSHQALGGHRASHKKVKGCFARTNPDDGGALDHSMDTSMDADDDSEQHNAKFEEKLLQELPETSLTSLEEDKAIRADNEEMPTTARKNKSHECSICHRVFNSGQALGGHKRCHWGGGGAAGEVTSAKAVQGQGVQGGQPSRPVKEAVLDLNLPAPEYLEEMMAQGEAEAGSLQLLNYLPAAAAASLSLHPVYA
ncbi:uncharacterized protein [Physcomitrium patens]|uniref:C2H2-type domain-containing protein n=2 Tax=Physcomitrium patens TaxID=3218 RepID=A0A2K1IQ91_PHYPA|nr:uncharacterized protein LOC112273868 isoform X1 [Physcomitrium patens]PNR31437.1 hypothetical protein PHYPA_025558 [Physcomitrium patens]|eukprot:XP_024358652.1 uncharacterized protein LOC112273868 isoform X1 [Physcomitrella patens]